MQVQVLPPGSGAICAFTQSICYPPQVNRDIFFYDEQITISCWNFMRTCSEIPYLPSKHVASLNSHERTRG
jgi:hypothetical protein